MSKERKITVNGKIHTVECPDQMPLLWVLRDLLNLKGTKFSCGKGICGSCTIHVDGKPTRSCILPVTFAEGKQVTTIEGLSKTASHPLQKAWKKYNVPQCGYCQPGQVMNAAGLLNENKNPTSSDITSAMEGNICRCGTYKRIKQAIYFAAHNKELEE